MASPKSPAKKNRRKAEMEDEIEEVPSNSITARLTRITEKIASTSIGQFGIRKIDNILWTIEKSAKWSLPRYTRHVPASEEPEKEEKIHEPPLTRPLPWIFFIPMLIALRMIRTTVSVGALMLRKSPVTPQEMVHFIQSRRRKLRAIKYSGLRAIRMRHIQAAEDRRNGKIARRGMMARLSNIFNVLMCGSYGTVDRPTKVVVKKKDKSTNSERKKRHADESDDEEELGCNELLNKLADEDDTDDSSFAEDTILSSDVTISDDESETDNILNKTMNEKDTPKFATPKYRKSRSNPNSGVSAKASEPTNDNLDFMSTPKRSISHSAVAETTGNGPIAEQKMKNGENGHSTIEEIKKAPMKNGTAKEHEQTGGENAEAINNLPESQRSEAPPKMDQPQTNNHTNNNSTAAPVVTTKNPDRSHGGRGNNHNNNKKRRNNSQNSQNNRRNGGPNY
ncbi:type-2 histone deacetylase 2 isoform X3 [Culicoides brevitarsis]|uniref:type-2 histone deacetylase 2 isoform X3 n=1 Tax=Culicoides brevitarsis TaxID=469753 RepID=UPI00307CB185